ncbi:unnamed protein product, partial [Prorocentrum cordatum]
PVWPKPLCPARHACTLLVCKCSGPRSGKLSTATGIMDGLPCELAELGGYAALRPARHGRPQRSAPFGARADALAAALDEHRPALPAARASDGRDTLDDRIDEVPEDEVPEAFACALDARLRRWRRRTAYAQEQAAATEAIHRARAALHGGEGEEPGQRVAVAREPRACDRLRRGPSSEAVGRAGLERPIFRRPTRPEPSGTATGGQGRPRTPEGSAVEVASAAEGTAPGVASAADPVLRR